jgi:hypothetical protein
MRIPTVPRAHNDKLSNAEMAFSFKEYRCLVALLFLMMTWPARSDFRLRPLDAALPLLVPLLALLLAPPPPFLTICATPTAAKVDVAWYDVKGLKLCVCYMVYAKAGCYMVYAKAGRQIPFVTFHDVMPCRSKAIEFKL